jgi:hypothetical protein
MPHMRGRVHRVNGRSDMRYDAEVRRGVPDLK